MNFDFSDRERALREKIKGLFDQDSRVALTQLETGDTTQVRNTILSWLKILGQEGYLDLGLGTGEDSVALVAAQESLATISSSLFLSVEVSSRIFAQLIFTYGTPKQKSDLLPALKEGQLIGAVALSEEGMSIENNPLNTMGVPNNDGFNVSGSKSHVVNAPISDWIAVAGKMEESIAFFLIKQRSKGLSIGQRHATLGYNGVAIAPIYLKNCPVPSKDVIGPFGGLEPLKTVRMWEDQILTGASLGLMQRCFDVASNYAKTHVSGGKPIIAYQEVGFKLAEMLTLLQTAQLLAYRASWTAQTKDREAGVLAHCAKIFCTESAEEIASNALQILGGYGYLRGNPVEEGYRDAKYLQIAGTSSEISRMKVGEQVLERE